MRRAILVGALFAAAAAVLVAQETALGVSANAPTVDGKVQAGEYALTHDLNGTTLSASRTADKVYLAVSAPTTGWVAVGTGSQRMDGSRIYIGFVGSDGKVTFEEDLGQGHRHAAAGDAAVTARALSESNGRTVLEVELDAARVIPAGASALPLTVAYGEADALSSFHKFRAAVSIPLR